LILETRGSILGGQGRRQVKICGVDRHGEREARAYNGGLEAEPTGPTLSPSPCKKPVGFVSISGATSSKSGVDMSIPVHPVATPLWEERSVMHREDDGTTNISK